MNPDKTETSIFIDAEMLLSQIAHKELVRKKLKEFWDTNGEIIVNQYKDLLLPPEHINISKDAFDEKIKACKVLIISANSVEGAIVSHRLIKENNYNKLEAYAIDGQLYQFATIGTIPVLHIWPTNIKLSTFGGNYKYAHDRLNEALALLRKNTDAIISKNKAFFTQLREANISEIYSYGFSFSKVDLPYVKEIISAVKGGRNILWNISCHNPAHYTIFMETVRKCGFLGEFAVLNS